MNIHLKTSTHTYVNTQKVLTIPMFMEAFNIQ